MSGNNVRGEVVAECGGSRILLVPSFGAIAKFEQEFGSIATVAHELSQLSEDISRSPSLTNLASMLHCFTVDQELGVVGEWVAAAGYSRSMAALGDVLTKVFEGADPESSGNSKTVTGRGAPFDQ